VGGESFGSYFISRVSKLKEIRQRIYQNIEQAEEFLLYFGDSLPPDKKRITKEFVKLKDGTEIEDTYDKIILATGSLPIIPNIPGKDLENVQQVKLYQNAAEVIEKLKNPDIKDIVVVGAGYIGVELAEAFERLGKTVTMVDIAETCLPAYYDEPFTSLMKENLASHNINLEFGQHADPWSSLWSHLPLSKDSLPVLPLLELSVCLSCLVLPDQNTEELP